MVRSNTPIQPRVQSQAPPPATSTATNFLCALEPPSNVNDLVLVPYQRQPILKLQPSPPRAMLAQPGDPRHLDDLRHSTRSERYARELRFSSIFLWSDLIVVIFVLPLGPPLHTPLMKTPIQDVYRYCLCPRPAQQHVPYTFFYPNSLSFQSNHKG